MHELLPEKPHRVETVEELWTYSDEFERAFKKGAQVDGWTALAALAQLMPNENIGIFMATEDSEWVGLVIGMLPSCDLFPTAHIYHIYNEGKPKALSDLVDAVVDWIRLRGYNRLQACNTIGASDEFYGRLFHRAGPMTTIGSAVEFDIGNGS